MPEALINITVGLHETPATVTDRVLQTGANQHTRDGVVRLLRDLQSELVARDAKLAVRVDSVTRAAASQTVGCTQASCTAGDKLHIVIPGYGQATITGKAGTADATLGEWSIDTSDTAVAASIVAAIKGYASLKRFLTASNASGTVTITAQAPGSWATGVTLRKEVTTGAALTLGGAALANGSDVMPSPTIVVTFGTADITANDTIAIGGRKYTWKASASADGEITLSTNETTAATNFAAAVNADANLAGLVTASRTNAVVTLTWVGDPRMGQHVVCNRTETNSGSVTISGGTTIIGTDAAFKFAAGSVIGSSSTRVYGGRGAA